MVRFINHNGKRITRDDSAPQAQHAEERSSALQMLSRTSSSSFNLQRSMKKDHNEQKMRTAPTTDATGARESLGTLALPQNGSVVNRKASANPHKQKGEIYFIHEDQSKYGTAVAETAPKAESARNFGVNIGPEMHRSIDFRHFTPLSFLVEDGKWKGAFRDETYQLPDSTPPPEPASRQSMPRVRNLRPKKKRARGRPKFGEGKKCRGRPTRRATDNEPKKASGRTRRTRRYGPKGNKSSQHDSDHKQPFANDLHEELRKTSCNEDSITAQPSPQPNSSPVRTFHLSDFSANTSWEVFEQISNGSDSTFFSLHEQAKTLYDNHNSSRSLNLAEQILLQEETGQESVKTPVSETETELDPTLKPVPGPVMEPAQPVSDHTLKASRSTQPVFFIGSPVDVPGLDAKITPGQCPSPNSSLETYAPLRPSVQGDGPSLETCIARPYKPPPLQLKQNNTGANPTAEKRSLSMRSAISARTPFSAFYAKYICVSPSPTNSGKALNPTVSETSLAASVPSSPVNTTCPALPLPGVLSAIMESNENDAYQSVFNRMIEQGITADCMCFVAPSVAQLSQSHRAADYEDQDLEIQNSERAPDVTNETSTATDFATQSEAPRKGFGNLTFQNHAVNADLGMLSPRVFESCLRAFNSDNATHSPLMMLQSPVHTHQEVPYFSSPIPNEPQMCPVSELQSCYNTENNIQVITPFRSPLIDPLLTIMENGQDVHMAVPVVTQDQIDKLLVFDECVEDDSTMTEDLSGAVGRLGEMVFSNTTITEVNDSPSLVETVDMLSDTTAPVAGVKSSGYCDPSMVDVSGLNITPVVPFNATDLSWEFLLRLIVSPYHREQLVKLHQTTHVNLKRHLKGSVDSDILWTIVGSAAANEHYGGSNDCAKCLFPNCIHSVLGFWSAETMANHLAVQHTTHASLYCPYCYRRFCSRGTLQRHMATACHHEKPTDPSEVEKAKQAHPRRELESFVRNKFTPQPETLTRAAIFKLDAERETTADDEVSRYEAMSCAGRDSAWFIEYSDDESDSNDDIDAGSVGESECEDIKQDMQDPEWLQSLSDMSDDSVGETSSCGETNSEYEGEVADNIEELFALYAGKSAYERQCHTAGDFMDYSDDTDEPKADEFFRWECGEPGLPDAAGDKDLWELGAHPGKLTNDMKATLRFEMDASKTMDMLLLTDPLAPRPVRDILSKSSRPAVTNITVEEHYVLLERNILRRGRQSRTRSSSWKRSSGHGAIDPNHRYHI